MAQALPDGLVDAACGPGGLARLASRTAIRFLALAILALGASPAKSQGTLTDNIRVTSQQLGYDLQYRLYLPAGHEDLSDLPVIYVVDGQWYIETGEMHLTLDELIAARRIAPVIAVFVDNRDPDNLRYNRRNGQFFCNEDYIRFFTDELIPTIDADLNTRSAADSRVILGLSFGGLNSACLGLHAHDAIRGIAMQSPAMHPVRYIFSAYEDSTRMPIDVFLSSGNARDNEARTRRLRDILQDKGYPLKYIEVPFGHDWDNWKPLLDDVLLHYFAIDRP